MPSALPIIWDVNDNNQQGRISDFLQEGTALPQDMVKLDRLISVMLRPVVVSLTKDQENGRPWDDDHLSGDTYILGIGDPDEAPTGGTFTLTIGSTTIAAQAYDVSAATLQTALSAAWATEGFTGCTVQKLNTGVFVVTGTNDNVAVPAMTYNAAGLTPASDISVSRLVIGNETPTSLAQQIVTLEQQLLAATTPSTSLPVASVTASKDQTATATSNTIMRIEFTEGAYDGKFSITATAAGVTSAVGFGDPLMSAEELGRLLANHPSIAYQGFIGGVQTGVADNIIPSVDGPDFLVEFVGTLSGVSTARSITAATVANPTELTFSASHNYQTGDSITITASSGFTPNLDGTYTFTKTGAATGTIAVNVSDGTGTATAINTTNSSFTAADVSLKVPLGVTGTLNLNTLNMVARFAATTEDSISTFLSVKRTRASGEVRESLQIPVTIKREVIDTGSIIPMTALIGVPVGNVIYVDAVLGDDDNAGGFGAAKRTLASAIAAATSGDLIFMFPGEFDQGDVTNTLPDGVHLKGSGLGITTISSDRELTDGPIVEPGEGSIICDLTIEGNAAAGAFQSPIGTTSGSSWTTAYVERVGMVNDSDGFYFEHGTRTIYAKDCVVRTKFDGVNFAGGTGHLLDMVDCEFFTIGPTQVSPAQTIARCIALGVSSSVRMIGGRLTARDGGATFTECFSSGASVTGYFENVEFDVSNGSDPARYARLLGGTIEIRNCRFMQNNTTGLLFSAIGSGTALSVYGCYITTTGNASGFPISLAHAGSTLKVRNCTLVSNGSQASINNQGATVYTVDAYGSFANNAVDTDVTANGLTVNAAVT